MKNFFLLVLLVIGALFLVGCAHEVEEMVNEDHLKTATFAGGCFWCIEAAYDGETGVSRATSGYTGGDAQDASYEKVARGMTGHYEAVEVVYDPEKITYEKLLDIFWRSIDPTDAGGQFADRGTQYKTAIFYHDDKQKRLAEASKAVIAQEFDKPIVTEILPAEEFYPAEEYHQDFAKKQASYYERYAQGSGRKPFLEEQWKN